MTDTIDITMPQLSDAMEEGTIVKWLIEDGGEVAVGDELVEIETDKATMAYAAEAEGTLQIVVPEGDAVPVGVPIARVGAAVAVGAAAAAGRDVGQDSVAVPVARRDSWFGDGAKAVATPVARRYAQVHGIALGDVTGSGPRGRIVKSDVLRAAGVAVEPDASSMASPTRPPSASDVRLATPQAANRTAVPEGGADAGTTRQAPTRLQQVIARRMVESKTTVPHFQVQTEVIMDEAIALRSRLKTLVGEGEKPPSFNDLIVRASAVALREHPLANGSWVDDAFELHERINVGIAVAAEGGLVVPTIFDTDHKSLGQVGSESRRLAAAVRDGSVSPAELSGGTFTVSNLGMYGMTAITPVVNPPQAAILGVGAMRQTLARDGDEIVDRPLLTLTLSCDHRILYGADAALFLARIRDLLEQPLRLAL
ncbi:MAG: 2-oxo acid dehydrogenase subunit E2 [Patulibacter sp.]|nr:2-oxo acid dehydrogenase subunit E2 [Patulibacter sp.]